MLCFMKVLRAGDCDKDLARAIAATAARSPRSTVRALDALHPSRNHLKDLGNRTDLVPRDKLESGGIGLCSRVRISNTHPPTSFRHPFLAFFLLPLTLLFTFLFFFADGKYCCSADDVTRTHTRLGMSVRVRVRVRVRHQV